MCTYAETRKLFKYLLPQLLRALDMAQHPAFAYVELLEVEGAQRRTVRMDEEHSAGSRLPANLGNSLRSCCIPSQTTKGHPQKAIS